MFGPDDEHGHNGCSLLVDNISHEGHLHAVDTAVAVVSGEPVERLSAFKPGSDPPKR